MLLALLAVGWFLTIGWLLTSIFLVATLRVLLRILAGLVAGLGLHPLLLALLTIGRFLTIGWLLVASLGVLLRISLGLGVAWRNLFLAGCIGILLVVRILAGRRGILLGLWLIAGIRAGHWLFSTRTFLVRV